MMHIARKIATWMLISVFLAIAVAVGAEWWIEVLKQKGYYDDAAAQWDSLAGRAAALALSLPVLLATAFFAGLVIGMWAEAGAAKRRMRGSETGPADEAKEGEHLQERRRLAHLMERAIHSADVALKEGTGAAYRTALPGLESTLMTVGRCFEIPIPDVRSNEAGPRESLKRGMEFLVQVGPLLNGGHFEEARQRASLFAAAPKKP